MSFRPASASTTASSRRSVTSASRRTPNSEPTMPPTTTAPAHSGAALGSACTLMVSPKRPATELTRIKAAETLALWRGSAHPITRRSGLKKMPPPIPVSPETKPSPAPKSSASIRGTSLGCGRCFRGVGLLCSSGVRESEHPSTQSSDVMIMQVLHCPHCQGTDIIRNGTTRQGKQRYRCQENACKGRTFLLEYTYAGHAAGVKQQIIDMAMNASGIRDTARVLHVSPTTVIKELKKKSQGCSR